ncbi:SemiSWEET family sugar transporter [Spiroplasma alleghenense]|uniref:MtN3 and saliva related transmembrane protein n=1 Tax=Spiroplasma alleghenense TaxID=216931 RepID=A0A345Z4Z7_9MOLU|nr:SemiSWEET family transporter [Spiroplasma alleghenense]AXK51676.1 MtN3 and saliva related transmembrane protein [Spiroplasma alleghenense]
MNIAIEVIGWIGFTTASLLLIPQVIKTIKTNDTSTISTSMFIVGLINFTTWTIYGFLIASPQIYIANIIAVTCNIIILGYIIKNHYKAKKAKNNEINNNI